MPMRASGSTSPAGSAWLFSASKPGSPRDGEGTVDNGSWIEQFSEREQKEILFSQLYAKQFVHGTDGHNAKIIIAKLAGLLNNCQELLKAKDQPPVVNR
jgi:hypothetical protein